MLQHWRPNAAALEERPKLAVASMPQHWEKCKNAKIGIMVDAAALSTQCRSIRGLWKIEDPMPQHWEKGRNPKIGKMVNAAALSTQCRSMRGSWKIEDSML